MRLTVNKFRYNGSTPDKIRYRGNTVYKINYNSACVYEVATLPTPTISSILKDSNTLAVMFRVDLSYSDRTYLTSEGYGTVTLSGYTASGSRIITTTTDSLVMNSYTDSAAIFTATYSILDVWSGNSVQYWSVVWEQESYQASSVSSQFVYPCDFGVLQQVPSIDEPYDGYSYRLGADYALIGLYVVDSDPWISIDMSAYYEWLWQQLLVGVDIPSEATYILPCTSKNLARCIEYYASAGNSGHTLSDLQDNSLAFQDYPDVDDIGASLSVNSYHNVVVVFNPPQSFGRRTFQDNDTVWQPLVADIATGEKVGAYREYLPGNPSVEEGQVVYFLPDSDLLDANMAIDHSTNFARGTTPLDLAISQLGAYMRADAQGGEIAIERKPYYTLGEALQQRWVDNAADDKLELLNAFIDLTSEQVPLYAPTNSWPLTSAIMDGVGAAVFGQRILTETEYSYDIDWSELIKNAIGAVTDTGFSLDCTPVGSPNLEANNSALIQAFLYMVENSQWSITVEPPASIRGEAVGCTDLSDAVDYVTQLAEDEDMDLWVTKP